MSLFDHKRVEEEILAFWKKDGTYDKVKRAGKGKKPFFFVDGPPYATGSIHMGTAWNKIIKDVYLRYARMLGLDAWDQPGYDTHGTPIETKVEKQLGFGSKKDIEKYGIGKFIEKCRIYATKYIDVMSGQFANLGVWMDWKDPYLTLDNRYIEGAWYTFKRAFDGGFLYKGKYPVHVCPRCETVVAYNEIEYSKLTDTSIYVKLRIKGEKNKYLIIWTTTPWTLPGNTGVMVHPKFTYVEAELGNGEVWIVAKERLQELMGAIEAGYKVVREMPGKELAGMEYEGPLQSRMRMPKLRNAYRVILSDRYVHLEEGTGLVHTAPGHGKEDFDAGTKAGLPAICPVMNDGSLTKETGKYSGKHARVVDEEIIRDLEEEGMLVLKHPHTHDYPMCWRCDTPLLQVGVPQWFFKVTGVRDKLLSENRRVNWMPGWAGDRFNDWLENLGDWPISRQRYWGIPLPIWECGCGNIMVIGSFSELKRLSGVKREMDFHRPAIDKVRLRCTKCGKLAKRVPDVLDVWFDSGVCTWASLEYPRKKALFERMWPSVFQTEGPDQFRGWWNSQMITSVLTFGRAPFRNVLLHGFVMDVKGIKLSKSKGNFVDPAKVIEQYGRDVLRFYLLRNPLWNDFYFNWEEVKEVSRLFTVFWNSYLFVRTYAPKPPARKPALRAEDRWIISKVNSLIGEGKAPEELQVHRLVQGLWDFILNDFSRWYIKIIRDRVSPWYKGADRAGADYALNYVLERLLRLMAPITPFISDKICTDLYGKKSVHLSRWPMIDKKMHDRTLESQMEVVKNMIETMNFARQEKGTKLRWPIRTVEIWPAKGKGGELRRVVGNFDRVIMGMGNVKELRVARKGKPAGKGFVLGKLRLGDVMLDEAMLREIIRKVQVARKEKNLSVRDRIGIWFDADGGTRETLKKHRNELLVGVGAAKASFCKIEGEGLGCLDFKGKRIKFEFGKLREKVK
ncbi:MAG: isoleucine--tRNA ligase [Candidatus Aenigmarchaeota archaeon]|nr:isoleucine--tRNA ligase [Candidatus Aenigmarchaeota archaeon]